MLSHNLSLFSIAQALEALVCLYLHACIPLATLLPPNPTHLISLGKDLRETVELWKYVFCLADHKMLVQRVRFRRVSGLRKDALIMFHIENIIWMC